MSNDEMGAVLAMKPFDNGSETQKLTCNMSDIRLSLFIIG